MRINSWYVTLGIVGASVAAAAVVACSSTTTVNPPAETGDAATTPEPDAAVDTGTPAADTGTPPATDAGEDAGTCAVTLSTGDTGCDTCVATSCCTQLTGCDTADDAGTNDAGLSACEQLLGCINDVNTADGGTDGGASTCDPSYSSSEQTSATAVLTCIESACATQCPGL
jgi:hypothetical protein